ncbi:MAG: tetratricopeptide repeat protein [Bacteroidales bacterium]|nr:MAG: tetratricopeptide repeat protein [Bacteroidales bacterium]
MLRHILNTLIIGVLSINSLMAVNVDALMSDANKSYSDGKFDDAVKAYESIVKQGYRSDILYYNLGNAYFKTKNISAAILNYERALLLNPGDENTRFNLDLAKTFTVDRIEPLPEFFLITFFNKFRLFMSTNGWAYSGLFFFILSLVLAYFFWFTYNPSIKKISFSVGVLTILITLLSFTFSLQQKNIIVDHRYGILMPSVVAVKSSPGDSGKDLFVLHAGTKVKIIDSVGD